MDKLEVGAAAALLGAGVYQIHSIYTTHAGSLSDMRQTQGTDTCAQQQLIDADVLAGGLALLAGGTLSVVTRKWMPVGLAMTSFGLVSLYYHRALNTPGSVYN